MDKLALDELRSKFVAMFLTSGEMQLAQICSVMEDQDFLFAVVCEPGSIAGYLNWINDSEYDLDTAVAEIASAIDTTIRSDNIDPEHSHALLSAMVGSFAAFVTFGLSGIKGE